MINLLPILYFYQFSPGLVVIFSILSINKLATSQGIVFKNQAVLEQLYKISIAIFSILSLIFKAGHEFQLE